MKRSVDRPDGSAAHTRREIGRIAWPVSAESVVQLVLNLMNQVIVGTLGTATIAAVGLANNALFIGVLCLTVLGSGCAILASRAHGRGDGQELARIATFSILLAVALSLLIALPLALSGEHVLRLVGAAEDVARIGGPYLSRSALALPFITASVVLSSTFRTVGQARLPLVVTLVTLTLTPVLAWVFVARFGWGAAGAAWAGVVTQVLRALLLGGTLFFGRHGVHFRWPNPTQARRLLRELVPLVLPLFITEIIFSSGVFLFALIAQRTGTAQLAAFQIVSALENVFIVGAVGFNAAATILTARAIGQADAREVWRWSGSVWRFGALTAVAQGALFGLCALLIPQLFPHTTPDVQRLALWGALMNAAFMPVKASNMIAFGVLASGGDTRYLLLSDVVTVLVVGLPVAYLLAFGLDLGLWGVFLGRLLGEETVRIWMLLWRYRSGVWFKLAPGGTRAP